MGRLEKLIWALAFATDALLTDWRIQDQIIPHLPAALQALAWKRLGSALAVLTLALLVAFVERATPSRRAGEAIMPAA